MARRRPTSKPTWTDVKAQLASFDRLGLLDLIQDLYAAHKDNQTFLHARFGLGDDVLKPYKETLDRWLWPDVLRNQDTSVVKAKQAISSYRKAVGEPAGLAELMVFYCERAAGFSNDIGYQDDGYFDALVRTFEQAVGLKPKTYARLRRFDRVLARHAAEPDASWADIAAAEGYTDQAHLSREFRAFAGVTPGRYRRLAPAAPRHLPVS